MFFILGIITIIEMGTGVNGQIIGTSTFWRFELWTSLLLTALIIPLSYFLTVKYGIIGPAIANLISFSIYNFARYWFLLKRFKMQPFTNKTVEVIVIALAAYIISYFMMIDMNGITGIILRTLIFSLFFLILIYTRKITPYLEPIIHVLKNKFNIKKVS